MKRSTLTCGECGLVEYIDSETVTEAVNISNDQGWRDRRGEKMQMDARFAVCRKCIATMILAQPVA